jgi:ATP-binding cassette, subfamily C (CFTR/MRP), member 1
MSDSKSSPVTASSSSSQANLAPASSSPRRGADPDQSLSTGTTATSSQVELGEIELNIDPLEESSKPPPKNASDNSKASQSDADAEPDLEQERLAFGYDALGRNGEDRAGIFSRIFFTYIQPVFSVARRRQLQQADVMKIRDEDRVTHAQKAIGDMWQDELAYSKDIGKQPSLLKIVLKYQTVYFIYMMLFQLILRTSQILQPLVLERMIKWLADPTQPEADGWWYATALFCLPFLGSLADAHFFQNGTRMFVRVRAALSAMVYRKSLDLSASGRQESTVGQIVNLMSSDSEKVAQLTYGVINMILLPVHVSLILYFIYETIGVATFAGLGIMFIVVPFLAFVMKKVGYYTMKRAGISDKRIRTTNEVLQGIRVVKFYGWEESFADRIEQMRSSELGVLLRLTLYSSSFIFCFLLLPVLISASSFGVFILDGGTLTPVIVFRSLAFFNALQFPLIQLPSAVQSIVVALVSCKRLTGFFLRQSLSDEQDRDNTRGGADDVVSDAGSDASLKNTTKKKLSDSDIETVPALHIQVDAPDGISDTAEASDGIAAALLEDTGIPHDTNDDTPDDVRLTDASFTWDDTSSSTSPYTLRNINFRLRRGKLTAVIGPVGCGKSSLLSGILHEISMVSGKREESKESTLKALVAQTPWIQNMSIRDNILFGQPMDQQRYDAAIHASALDDDLDILPLRDATMIGDRGINLSGGQKQRVALCRAIYMQHQVVLLDDPLSAVDANVGKHIFEHAIAQSLKDSTVMFVTNQLQFLSQCDYIYVMKAGTIVAAGTFDELHSNYGDFKALISHHAGMLQTKASDEKDSTAIGDGSGEFDSKHPETSLNIIAPSPETSDYLQVGSQQRSRANSLVDEMLGPELSVSRNESRTETKHLKQQPEVEEEEEVYVGAVSSEAYGRLINAMGGLWKFGFPMIATSALSQGALVLSSFVLAWWSEGKWGKDDSFFFLLYIGIGVGSALLLFIRSLVFAFGSVTASKTLHDGLLQSVLNATSMFFDMTPVGRVLNRFSKDIDTVDARLGLSLQNAVGVIFSVLGALVSVALVTPEFTVALIGVSVAYFFLQRYFSPAALQIQRMESVSRSPIYAHFSETLDGVDTIRAAGVQQQFIEYNEGALDTNAQNMFVLRLVFRWASSRVLLLNAVLGAASGYLIANGRGSLDVSLSSLVLTMVLNVAGFFGFLIMIMTEVDNHMNSVERVQHYTSLIQHEPPRECPEHDPPLGTWPTKGHVEFENVVMRYRPGLEPAIKDLNCDIVPHSKVGVAGRTGSGKSTTLLTLFRMYPLLSGRIKIDDVDISKLGLKRLRQALAIIPQDPVIFSGTLRSNLDPFGVYSDEELTEVLKHIHMHDFVSQQEDGLDLEVIEYGGNLSAGQRQLICMGRAMLKRPKVLCLDEATSSIDSKTDSLIQETVRTQFADATVITIAHRLNTIMDSDNILVLHEGRVAEFGSPATLLSDEAGKFSGMHSSMVTQEQHGHENEHGN